MVRGLLAALLLALAPPAAAQGLPEAPILRIETGMHGATLRRVDADAAGRVLVTASDDGTARLWDAATGEALVVLRLPLGTGHDGKAYAAALSPDGRIAAVGGWTLYGTDSNSLFLFDARSGRLMRRIPGFGNVINDLAFSPDGRFLAAGSHGTAGVTVLEAAEWTRAVVLGGYGDAVYGLDWDAAGRLATVSYDGHLRLHAADLRLLRSVWLGQGALPFSVAFSPDGRELALGFEGAARVELRDARTLALLHAPAVEAPMSSVAWSADGQQLLAGGHAWTRVEGRVLNTLRVWPGAGRGAAADWPVALNAIMDLAALPGGEVVVGSSATDLARLVPDGRPRWGLLPALPNWRSRDKSHLRLAPDGQGVGMTPYTETPLHFDPAGRRLAAAAAPGGWPAARDSGGAMWVTDWLDSPAPRLNGRPLGILAPHEWARSVAVAAAGDFAVLGADWNLYALSPDGALRWRVPVPGAAWAVNLAGDGRTLVAALGDGTIRWYRAADGAELLALFVHADRTRWVAWTPTGHFDASAGGEDLIGWHVNRGLDAAPDFFPAYVFRERFYRAGLAEAVIAAADVPAALARLGPAPAAAPLVTVLPPAIRIRAPEAGARVEGAEVAIELDVSTAPDAPLTEVQARVNGRPAAARLEGADRLRLTLPEVGDSDLRITLNLANRHGFGPPADLHLVRAPPALSALDSRGTLHVLAIGVARYADPALNLVYPGKDARDFAALVRRQEGGLWRAVEIEVLQDDQADARAVRAALTRLRRRMTDADTAMIFFAGHGMNDEDGDFYLMTHEGDAADPFSTALRAREMTDFVGRIPGRVVYFVDACHSGNLGDLRARAARPLDINGHLQDLRSATGAVVFASSQGSQPSYESTDWGNGAFTLALVEGLGGTADRDRNGAVSVSELEAHVAAKVRDLTGGRQTPVRSSPSGVPDFPLALLR